MALLAALVAACDEDRAEPQPVVQPQGQQDSASGPPGRRIGPAEGRNPISGHRRSGLGKALDAAEDLKYEKIPEYHRRVNEEADPNKR